MTTRVYAAGCCLMFSHLWLGVYAIAQQIPQRTLDLFEQHTLQASDDFALPYRLLKPLNIEAETHYPLVLFLHGAGERGADNRKQLVHGMSDFASPERMREFPAFVVAPQCPAGKKWVDVDWSAERHTTPEMASPAMAATIELVEQLMAQHPIDTDRVYVTGLSMGGYGTWDILVRRPDWFAAALPICGGGDAGDQAIQKIVSIPVWVVHGDRDRAVPVERSRKMIEALKSAGGTPKYTERKGVGHDSWTETYADVEYFRWLFAQSRESVDNH